MNNNYEKMIQLQEEIIAELKKLHTADQTIIESKKQQLHFLQEKISSLEKEKQALAGAVNKLLSICENLEHICNKQQMLLSSFSGSFSDP